MFKLSSIKRVDVVEDDKSIISIIGESKDKRWKLVPNLDTTIYISDHGDIFSESSGKYLKPTIINGYRRLISPINGKSYNMSIARFIAETWIPNPDNKPNIDHIDTNRENDHYKNLRWVTALENTHNELTADKLNIKAINQYDIYGKFIATHISMNQAAKATGATADSIMKCLRGSKSYTKGFQFKYKDKVRDGDIEALPQSKIDKACKNLDKSSSEPISILLTDRNGNIHQCKSISEAAKILKCSTSTVYNRKFNDKPIKGVKVKYL